MHRATRICAALLHFFNLSLVYKINLSALNNQEEKAMKRLAFVLIILLIATSTIGFAQSAAKQVAYSGHVAEAPGVWLADNGISINGASGAKVFVDNREVKLKGEELLAYLRSLKSDDVRQIEVIPIAGAEYDANTRGGVVRISLRRRLNNGMQGNVSMGTSLSPSLQQYMPAASVNARVGKWSINAAASGTLAPDNNGETSATRTYTTDDMHFDK